jgi:hypothetical protein
VHSRAAEQPAGDERRELLLKGKSEPEIVRVRRIDSAMPVPNAHTRP